VCGPSQLINLNTNQPAWEEVMVLSFTSSRPAPPPLVMSSVPRSGPASTAAASEARGRRGCAGNPSMNVGQCVGLCLRHSARGQTEGSRPRPSYTHTHVREDKRRGDALVLTHTHTHTDTDERQQTRVGEQPHADATLANSNSNADPRLVEPG